MSIISNKNPQEAVSCLKQHIGSRFSRNAEDKKKFFYGKVDGFNFTVTRNVEKWRFIGGLKSILYMRGVVNEHHQGSQVDIELGLLTLYIIFTVLTSLIIFLGHWGLLKLLCLAAAAISAVLYQHDVRITKRFLEDYFF